MRLTQEQEDARAELRAWLHDMEAIRPALDSGLPGPVQDAWRVARANMTAAAARYAAVMERVAP